MPLYFVVLSLHANAAWQSIDVRLGHQSFQLQLANTLELRRLGLMHRQSLPLDQGMLFIYPSASEHRIWMKNTLIPLTVIWLDDAARIIGIRLLQPCRQVNCPVFSVNQDSRFIIELNQQQFDNYKVGDQFSDLLLLLGERGLL